MIDIYKEWMFFNSNMGGRNWKTATFAINCSPVCCLPSPPAITSFPTGWLFFSEGYHCVLSLFILFSWSKGSASYLEEKGPCQEIHVQFKLWKVRMLTFLWLPTSEAYSLPEIKCHSMPSGWSHICSNMYSSVSLCTNSERHLGSGISSYLSIL